MEIPKIYNPKESEDAIYQRWEESGVFTPEKCVEKGVAREDAEPFTIMMPPPNVTGVLHLGHALENSLMDTMARFWRMRGRRVLFVPGTDHAAVATQARVEKDLVAGGVKHPRKEFGREKLLEVIREYAEECKSTILKQVRKIGSSCDWSRLAYTFDSQRSKAVNELFVRMYYDGLIYRGYRVVNWSVMGQSTCSDEELVYVERGAKLYTFRYSKDFPIPIATTRPETKFGDTAVAVHPDDKRYQQYIGKEFIVDVGAKHPLKIKIIADQAVDPEFGTGAVGVTPAHSQADFEMKEKHGLELIQVIDQNGKMTEAAGKEYAGWSVETAREKFVSWIKENNLLISEEDIKQNVATSDRFEDVVEVLPMTQWFVSVNTEIPGRGKTLKDLMRDAVIGGLRNDLLQKVKISPEHFEKIYLHWIDNLRDWCISRQIWWGHRIPVWYCKKTQNSKLKTQNLNSEKLLVTCYSLLVTSSCPPIASLEPPAQCPHCGGTDLEQDPDTLDTWFSSGTWTFSTLGWPDAMQDGKKIGDLAQYHPTSWMQMGYELVFFWMARMILMSAYALGEIPFYEVYIHGLVRDKTGKKFSKSLRNTIDPLDLIEKYGTDALRLSLLMGVAPGNDMRFYEEKVEHYQHFVNKLWNISRYILGSTNSAALMSQPPVPQSVWDEWIVYKMHELISSVTAGIEKAEFARAGEMLYDFTWHEFADWYIEAVKVEKTKDEMLLYVLQNLLKLWHPFIPFVTEKIWECFGTQEMLIVEKWPAVRSKIQNPNDKSNPNVKIQIVDVKEIISEIRAARAMFQIPANESLNVIVKKESELLSQHWPVISRLAARVGERFETVSERPKNAIAIHSGGVELFLQCGSLDIIKEQGRLKKERNRLEEILVRIEKELQNPGFVENAPEEVIEKKRKMKEEIEEKVKAVGKYISS